MQKPNLDEPSWITLKEGSVEVSTLDDRSKERMSPNDQVYYTVSDGLVLIRSSAQANVDSWTTGDLRFDNKTLKEMAKVIERRYDVKIRIMDSSLVEEYFTCHFRKDLTIAQAMELLKETRRVDYRIEKKTVYLCLNKPLSFSTVDVQQNVKCLCSQLRVLCVRWITAHLRLKPTLSLSLVIYQNTRIYRNTR